MLKCDDAPCPHCPFSRTSTPGDTGPLTAEQMLSLVVNDRPVPCRCTVDAGDMRWREDWEEQVRRGRGDMKYCAGALVFAANIMKSSADPQRPKREADREKVFATLQEFVRHHGGRR
jgi:hypothetical protein